MFVFILLLGVCAASAASDYLANPIFMEPLRPPAPYFVPRFSPRFARHLRAFTEVLPFSPFKNTDPQTTAFGFENRINTTFKSNRTLFEVCLGDANTTAFERDMCDFAQAISCRDGKLRAALQTEEERPDGLPWLVFVVGLAGIVVIECFGL